MSEHGHIRVTVNGREWSGDVAVRTSLSDFIRHDAGLTGTHVACEHGVCGSCTVIFDGRPIRSCLMLAVQADGHSVQTVESLADDNALSGFQQAMLEEHGLQCGFCTPGILMSIAAAQASGMSVESACAELLDGHICRCTGYAGIRAAIRRHWARTGGRDVADRAAAAYGHGAPGDPSAGRANGRVAGDGESVNGHEPPAPSP